MTRLLIDTNRYSDIARGEADAAQKAQSAERLYIPFIVLAELRSGFLQGSLPSRNEQRLKNFLRNPRVRVLYPDEQTTHHYAQIAQQLRSRGTPIPTNDIWIAALAVQHALTLYARDRHFDHLPQLARA